MEYLKGIEILKNMNTDELISLLKEAGFENVKKVKPGHGGAFFENTNSLSYFKLNENYFELKEKLNNNFNINKSNSEYKINEKNIDDINYKKDNSYSCAA